MKRALLLFACGVGLTACEAPTVPPAALSDVYPYNLDTNPPAILRWPSGSRIRVHLEGGSAQRTAVMEAAFAAGAARWNSAVRFGEYELVRASSVREADVLLRWADDVSPIDLTACLPAGSRAVTTFCLDPDDPERLYAYPNLDGTAGSVRMVVSVLGAEASFPERAEQLIVHELGHVLGIGQHSPDSGDLMHGGSPTRSTLSARDAATVRVLYHTEPHIVP